MKNKVKNINLKIVLVFVIVLGSIISFITIKQQTNTKKQADVENANATNNKEEVYAQWATTIGGSGDDYAWTNSHIIEASDGGYIIAGVFSSSTINLGNDITLKNNGKQDGMLIKYNTTREVEWAKVIGGTEDDIIYDIIETRDGGFIIAGWFISESINLDNNVMLMQSIESERSGMIIKYNRNGLLQWAKKIDQSDYNYNDILSVKETTDGDILVAATFTTLKGVTIQLGNNVKVTSNGGADTMIIKYNSEGTAQWAKSFGEEDLEAARKLEITSDGGSILVGHFQSNNVIDLGNGVTLKNNSGRDGMIIKYNRNGEAEWANAIGGTDLDELYDVIETIDKGYIAVGIFYSSNISLGNSINIKNNGGQDGMIIKYNRNGKVEWAKAIGGTGEELLYTIMNTEDGGYTVSGESSSSSINLENGKSLINNTGKTQGIIIKYDKDGNIQWTKLVANSIYGMQQTKDKGYLVLGYFENSSDLGNNLSVISNGGFDASIIKYERDTTSPTIELIPVSEEYAKTRKTKIEVGDTGGSQLNSDNSYQYYLSTSSEELIGGEWTTYTSGTEFEIGAGKTGQYYLFIKMIEDNSGNVSTANGSEEITIGEETYHRYGTYNFDNTEPVITKAELQNNILNIEANDTKGTENQSGVSKYRYIASKEKILNPQITEQNSTEVNVNELITIENINTIKYIYVIAEDHTGNRSEIKEVEVPKITIPEESKENDKEEVELEWNIEGEGEKIYKIYQKEETEEEWTQIGETEENRIKIGTVKDIASPEMPNVTVNGVNEDEKVRISQTAIDNGTTYKVHIEVCDKANPSIILSKSEEITVKITTGIKGYYYRIEENTDNAMSKATRKMARQQSLEEEGYTYVEGSNIELGLENNGKLLKMKAVDVAGNVGEESSTVINIESKVTVDLNGGVLEGNTETKVLTGAIGSTIELGTPTKEEYAFAGWEIVGRETAEEGNIETSEGENTNIGTTAEKTSTYRYGKIEGTQYTYGIEEETVRAKWKTAEYNYTIEYYYGENKDESKTKTGKAENLSIISEYEQEEKDGYIFERTENLPLTITKEESQNVIKVYYKPREDLSCTIKYIDKETNEEIKEAKTIENQKFGAEITTESQKIEIPGYVYIEENQSITIGTNNEENIIEIYYTKRTDIKYKIEYYLDGEKREEEIKEAKYGDRMEKYEYKEIEGYTQVEKTPLTIVLDESKNIIKIYYSKNIEIKIQYIDKNTDEIMEEKTEKGYIGKEIKTEAQDFENYILVEGPAEKKVIMQEGMIIKYYYAYVSEGVIEKHIDIETNEILYNKTYEGNEGDKYKTEPRKIEKYTLVEERYPENSEGIMTKEAITVNYYYIKERTILVKYKDRETNTEIIDSIVIIGQKGDKYTTEQKEIEGYEFIEVIGEVTGEMESDKEITYYYQKIKEPEIPGEGGAGDGENNTGNGDEIEDNTIAKEEIPKAGLTKQLLALSTVVLMLIIAIILMNIAVKRTKMYNKYKE